MTAPFTPSTALVARSIFKAQLAQSTSISQVFFIVSF